MKHYLSRKLLIITHQLSRTGAPIALLKTVRLLLDEGNEITLISMEKGPLEEEYVKLGITPIYEKDFLINWQYYLTYFQEFEGVICNTIVTFEAVHVLNYLTVPTLWWIHEPKEYFATIGEVLPDISNLNSNITVAVVSPLSRDYIKEAYGIEPVVLPIGTKDEKNQFFDENTTHYPDEKVKIACIGSYSYTKGHDLLSEAILSLSKEEADAVEFYFCSDEETCDERYLNEVKKLENNYSIHRMGALPIRKLHEFIREMDFVICPSRMETFSMVAAESMMLSTPVWISSGCGILGVIEDYKYSFEKENTEAIADVLKKSISIKNNELEYQKLKNYVREIYETYLSEDIFREKFFSFLVDLIPKKRLILLTGNYDIIDIFTHEFTKAFSRMGYDTFEFDCSDLENSLPKFGSYLARDGQISAVITFNFYSTFMELKEGQQIWREHNIPVITYLMDHPFCFAENMKKLGSNDILLCPDKNHMNYITKYYPNVSVSGFLGHGGIEKYKEKKPMKDRDIEVLYAGGISLPNVKKILPDFSKYDFDAKALGDEAYEYLIFHNNETTEEVLEKLLLSYDVEMSLEEKREFISDMHYVDLMVVSHYREKVVRTLAEAGVHVTLYGFGWEEFDWIKELNVDYRGRVSADEIIDLMADTKIVLSTMTWFKDGTHDRVFNGMLQGAFTITDTSIYMKEEFRGLYPDDVIAYGRRKSDKIEAGEMSSDEYEVGFFELDEIDKLPDMIKRLLENDETLEGLASAGYKKAKQFHTWEARALELDRDLLHYL
ncbi:MAG: glycosyltransferase [Lachnospiraceae bacterium]|nr:glycosyltransferase [Lachnospiraceae bacterium]